MLYLAGEGSSWFFPGWCGETAWRKRYRRRGRLRWQALNDALSTVTAAKPGAKELDSPPPVRKNRQSGENGEDVTAVVPPAVPSAVRASRAPPPGPGCA